MKDYFSDKTLQDQLPESFIWLENLKPSLLQKAAPGAHQLVLFDTDKKATDPFDAERLPENLKQALTQQIEKLGLKISQGVRLVEANGENVLLVAKNSAKVSARRSALQAGLDAANFVKANKVSTLHIYGPKEASAEDIFEGLAQGLYELASFKGKRENLANLPQEIGLVCKRSSEKSLQKTKIICQSLALARALGDAPPNWLDPKRLALLATELGQQHGFNVKTWNQKQIGDMGMGAFYSVGRGSAVESQMICIEIKGEDTSRSVALIGKGVTFDSGGTSLKPSAGMHLMKYDMSAAAALIGSAYALSKLKPPTNVILLIGAVENIIGTYATRPGDIVKTFEGKTVEILNTDAEGRLVLCDLLSFCRKEYKPEFMINAATLTGAVVIALGGFGSALMSNQRRIADYVKAIADDVSEPFWELPLWPEVAKELKSEFADLKNIANPNVKAGTIVAGAFLREFVGDTPWVHLDIAGTAWECTATGHPGPSASGFGLRTMLEACLRHEK